MKLVVNSKEGVCAMGRGCRRSRTSEASAACSTAAGPCRIQRDSRPTSGQEGRQGGRAGRTRGQWWGGVTQLSFWSGKLHTTAGAGQQALP